MQPFTHLHYKPGTPFQWAEWLGYQIKTKQNCTEQHLCLQAVGVTLRHPAIILTHVCKKIVFEGTALVSVLIYAVGWTCLLSVPVKK